MKIRTGTATRLRTAHRAQDERAVTEYRAGRRAHIRCGGYRMPLGGHSHGAVWALPGGFGTGHRTVCSPLR